MTRSAAETLRRAWLSNGSLIILAATAFLLADPVIVYIAVRGDFAIDFTCCYQQAGQRLLDDPSSLYAWTDTYPFRYSPWAAALLRLWPDCPRRRRFGPGSRSRPPSWHRGRGAGSRWTGDARWLVAGMVLLFPPIWHDLALGNVSVFTVAVLAVLLARRDGIGGVAFGLLLLLAPKPHLLPLALWLLFRRPRDGVATLATLGFGVGAGMAVFGVDRWVEWIGTFREPLERTFTANVGFSGLLGPAGVVVGVAVAVVGRRGAGCAAATSVWGCRSSRGSCSAPIPLSTTCRAWSWWWTRCFAADRAGWPPTRGS